MEVFNSKQNHLITNITQKFQAEQPMCNRKKTQDNTTQLRKSKTTQIHRVLPKKMQGQGTQRTM